MHCSKLNGDLEEISTSPTGKAINSVDRKSLKDALDDANTKPLIESQMEREGLREDDRAVLGLRNLIFDICNKNGGGHGGSALGMSAIGVALYKHVMRYNPLDSEWFDRDRFVLSNGEHHRLRSSIFLSGHLD